MKYHRPRQTSNQIGLKHGFRSGLEIAISQELDANKVTYTYEKVKLTYVKPTKTHTYTPDFYLQEQNIYIETKGLFTSADRQKMRLVKEQHPELDIRFVFSACDISLEITLVVDHYLGMWWFVPHCCVQF